MRVEGNDTVAKPAQLFSPAMAIYNDITFQLISIDWNKQLNTSVELSKIVGLPLRLQRYELPTDPFQVEIYAQAEISNPNRNQSLYFI